MHHTLHGRISLRQFYCDVQPGDCHGCSCVISHDTRFPSHQSLSMQTAMAILYPTHWVRNEPSSPYLFLLVISPVFINLFLRGGVSWGIPTGSFSIYGWRPHTACRQAISPCCTQSLVNVVRWALHPYIHIGCCCFLASSLQFCRGSFHEGGQASHSPSMQVIGCCFVQQGGLAPPECPSPCFLGSGLQLEGLLRAFMTILLPPRSSCIFTSGSPTPDVKIQLVSIVTQCLWFYVINKYQQNDCALKNKLKVLTLSSWSASNFSFLTLKMFLRFSFGMRSTSCFSKRSSCLSPSRNCFSSLSCSARIFFEDTRKSASCCISAFSTCCLCCRTNVSRSDS